MFGLDPVRVFLIKLVALMLLEGLKYAIPIVAAGYLSWRLFKKAFRLRRAGDLSWRRLFTPELTLSRLKIR